eukprot:c15536_g1_i1.p1 GENE.c15536_g1_i1~~c15536_g1_i1.p1  ORF type:complete len:444 (+),score=168.08 c15536_g1_i1:153-1484(+)
MIFVNLNIKNFLLQKKKYKFIQSNEDLVLIYRDAARSKAKHLGELAKLANVIGMSTIKDLVANLPEDYHGASTRGLVEMQAILDEDEEAELSELEKVSFPVVIERAKLLRSHKSPLVVLVVGDKGVGKSTYLWCWKNDSQISSQAEVPEIMKATITGDERSMVKGMRVMCMDSKGIDPSTEVVVEDQLRRSSYSACHIIILLVDGTESASVRRVKTYWLKEFDHYNVHPGTSLFIIGNKSDLPLNCAKEEMEPVVGEVLAEISRKFICPFWAVSSALKYDQIVETMKRIQCSVIFPPCLILRNPEFSKVTDDDEKKSKNNKKKKSKQNKEVHDAIDNMKKSGMRPVLLKVLAHIFQRADEDQDGLLNDLELMELQQRCYDKVNSFAQIKEQLVTNFGKNIVTGNGLSFPAFVMMMLMGVTQGRTDLVWRLLIGYGYGYDTTIW